MRLRCEQCGGELDVLLDHSVGICRYCGSKYTIPKEIEKKGNLFNRANYLRQSCKFDDASEVYKTILTENSEDADALWGLVLCRYGIEFVQDPKTKSRIPTCHRASKTSILLDPDYKAALRFCEGDEEKRLVFSENAKKIDVIQKEIRHISEREEKFDVFICYKETDDNGKRTPDSVIAHQIYDALTKAKIKTFFAKKTLESRIGSEYEPIIYAALNSARVMIVLGTKQEYFNAPWVRNEWSRYIDFMQDDDSKHLIPAYKDMTPYELPEEFSALQALDMSALGFMLDLCDGVKKIIRPQAVTAGEVAVAEAPAISKDGLYTRAMICLGNRDFYKALSYFEEILDMDSQNAQAYWGSLLASYQCANSAELIECKTEDWSKDARLTYALKYAKEEYKVYQETVEKYTKNFNKFAEAALSNGDFELSADWSKKYLEHNNEDGQAWWRLFLAQSKSKNEQDLFDYCVEALILPSESVEAQNAIKFSDEEKRQEYIKTIRDIEEAVMQKKIDRKYIECEMYMQQALKSMKNNNAKLIQLQTQAANMENKKLLAIRNYKSKYHQNNLFSLLFFLMFWCIGVYAVIAILNNIFHFDSWFAVSYLIAAASVVALVVVIGVLRSAIPAIKRNRTLIKMVNAHETALTVLIDGSADLRRLDEKYKPAEELYLEYKKENSRDLSVIKQYYSRFRDIVGEDIVGEEVDFSFENTALSS